MVVLVGIGNLKGSMISAAVLTLLPESLKFLSDYRMLIYSIVLIILTILRSSPKAQAFRDSLVSLRTRKQKVLKEANADGQK